MTFDPYLKWLGIRDKSPNHYRILGLDDFEQDRAVIRSAADRQMAHVRSHQLGPNGEACQEVLNRLAKARAILLKPDSKQRYDLALRQSNASSSLTASPPMANPVHAAQSPTQKTSAQPIDFAEVAKDRLPGKQNGRSYKGVLLVGTVAVALLLLAIGGWFAWQVLFDGKGPNQGPNLARKERAKSVSPNRTSDPAEQSDGVHPAQPNAKPFSEPTDAKSFPAKSPLSDNLNSGAKTTDGNVPKNVASNPDESSNSRESVSQPIRAKGNSKATGNSTNQNAEKEAVEETEKENETKVEPKVITFENPKVLEYSNTIFAIAVSPDKKYLAASGVEKRVAVWRISDWKKIASKEKFPGKLYDIAYSNDGKYLIAVGSGSPIFVLDPLTLEVVKEIAVSSKSVHRLSLDSNSTNIQALGIDGDLYTFDPEIGIRETRLVHWADSTGVCATMGEIFVSAKRGGSKEGQYDLSKFDSTGPYAEKIIGLPERPFRISVGRNPNELLVPMMTQVAIIDAFKKKPTQVWVLPEDRKRLSDLTYWPERDLYLSASKNGRVDVMMRNHKKVITTIKISGVDCYQVLPLNDSVVVTASRRKTKPIVVWQVAANSKELKRLAEQNSDFTADRFEGFELVATNEKPNLPDKERHAVDPEQLTVARKSVRKQYEAYFTAKPSRELIQNFIKAVDQTPPGNPVAQRALWEEVSDLSSSIGDAKTAIEMLERIDEKFKFDFWAFAEETILDARRRTKSEAQYQSLKSALENLVCRAIREYDYDMAKTYYSKLVFVLKKYPDSPLTKSLTQSFTGSIGEFQKIHRLKDKAAAKLLANPDDETANRQMGDYHFFIENDLDRTLPYWRKSNSPMARIALLESFADWDDEEDVLSLAKSWAEQASRQKGFVAQKMAIHAQSLFWRVKDSSKAWVLEHALRGHSEVTAFVNSMMVLK